MAAPPGNDDSHAADQPPFCLSVLPDGGIVLARSSLPYFPHACRVLGPEASLSGLANFVLLTGDVFPAGPTRFVSSLRELGDSYGAP